MCGIVGYNGLLPPNRDKLKILNLYNDERGGDSCGYYFGGHLKKASGYYSKWKNFLTTSLLTPAEENDYNFIGHARKASIGVKNEANAHPFIVNEDFVLAHNGTIKNIDALCEKYGIDYEQCGTDSIALAYLIDKQGFKVLEEYVGYAALLMTRISEPNVMWVFHGKSKEYKKGKSVEERPLFFLEEGSGVYFSSIKDSLLAISDEKEPKVNVLNHNVVFRVESGSIQTDDVILIDREDMYVNDYTYKNYDHCNSYGKLIEYPKPKELSLKQETKPVRCFSEEFKDAENFVYFWQGVYYDSCTNKKVEGPRFLNKRGIAVPETEKGNHFFFIDGLRIKDSKHYQRILLINDEMFRDKEIRESCMHPFLRKDAFGDTWFYRGHVANGSFTPMFSERSYNFTGGMLTKVTSNVKDDIIWIPNDGTVWANFYTNKNNITTLIENGKKENKQVTEDIEAREDTVEPAYVEAVYEYFNMRYNTYTELFEAPSTVFLAVRLAILNALNIPLSAEYSEETLQRIRKKEENVYTLCVRSKNKLQSSLPYTDESIVEYIMDALLYEETADTRSFLDDIATLESRLLLLDDTL